MATPPEFDDSFILSDEPTLRSICDDFERNWLSGKQPRIETFLSQAPAGLIERLTLQLVAVEVRLREARGESPELEEYERRFPSVAGQLPELMPDASETTVVLDRNLPRFLRSGDALGRYRLKHRLGRGGFGEVWQAYDPVLDRDVAVKTLRGDRPPNLTFNQSLVQEGQKLAKLTHPGIVKVLDAGADEGRAYLVSELKLGGTLLDRIRGAGPISATLAVQWTIAIARAVQFAHERGFVHRDLKPGNVLFDQEGKLFVCDFGLSASELDDLSEQSGVFGTWGYVPPEHARGQARFADPRSDVYSIGAILYVLLTGRLPFIATTVEQYRAQLLEREPRPLRSINPEIPAELEAICLRCLSKEPSERPVTALELAESLDRWLATADAGDAATARPRWPSRTQTAVLGSVAIAAIATIAFLGRGDVSSNATPNLESPRPLPPFLPQQNAPHLTPTVWAPYDDRTDRHGFNPESGSYTIETMGKSLFEAGKAKGRPLRLKAEFQLRDPQGYGSAGFFWNLESGGQIENGRACWAMLVGRNHESVPTTACICDYHIGTSNGRGIVSHYRAVHRQPLGKDVPTGFTLEADVSSHRVERIAVDGVEILDKPLPLPPGDWNLFESGSFGVAGEKTVLTVTSFSAQPLP